MSCVTIPAITVTVALDVAAENMCRVNATLPQEIGGGTKGEPMKKLYEIVDGSWSLQSEGINGMVQGCGLCYTNRRFEIIAKNCDLPVGSPTDTINSLLMRDIDNNIIVFTQERFIRPLTGTCPHCRETIKGKL